MGERVSIVSLDKFGYPYYGIDKNGDIWTKRYRNGLPSHTYRKMSIKPSGKGYRVATLVDSNKRRCMVAVRVLMLRVFVGEKPTTVHQACHENNIRSDDRLYNLSWGTPQKNQQDRIRHGTSNRGENGPGNLYTRDKILRVRELLERGLSTGKVGRIVGMSKSNVQAIKEKRIWGWL